MIIAVLSGKGGTGKTLLSVNLSYVSGDSMYVDCDVEEPNGHLFLKPGNTAALDVTVRLPVVDDKLCDGCKKCVEFCNFNALAYAGKKLVIFEEICHSCGGCMIVCPQKALSEKDKVIGHITKGTSGKIKFLSGMMNTGESSGVPIVKELLKEIRGSDSGDIFIDSPPGSACIVMESIKDADYCVLVAEPTIFGAHNLAMVHELVRLFGKKHGVVLNKCQNGTDPSEGFCVKNDIRILGRIPFDHDLGLITSRGGIAAAEGDRFKRMFEEILTEIKKDGNKV